MVRLIPEEPTFTTPSEQEVWQRVREGLGPDDVLIANFRLTDQDKDYEADLIVLMPEVGILVLEVKGGSVWHDADGWWQTRRSKDASIDPVTQVRGTKYAIRDYVARDPRWQRRNHVAWGHAVVTPYSELRSGSRGSRLPPVGAARPRRPGGPGRAPDRQRQAVVAGQACADVRRGRADRGDPGRAAAHVLRRERRLRGPGG